MSDDQPAVDTEVEFDLAIHLELKQSQIALHRTDVFR